MWTRTPRAGSMWRTGRAALTTCLQHLMAASRCNLDVTSGSFIGGAILVCCGQWHHWTQLDVSAGRKHCMDKLP